MAIYLVNLQKRPIYSYDRVNFYIKFIIVYNAIYSKVI